jgi:hypothetical protein
MASKHRQIRMQMDVDFDRVCVDSAVMRVLKGPSVFCVVLACGAAIAISATSLNAGRPAPEQTREGWVLYAGRWTRPSATVAWTQLFSVTRTGAEVKVRVEPVKQTQGLIEGQRSALVRVEGSPFHWVLDARGRVIRPSDGKYEQALRAVVADQRVELSEKPALQSIWVTPASVELVGRQLTSDGVVRLTQLTMLSDGAVGLYIGDERDGESQEVLSKSAPSFFDLLITDGQLVRECVVPLMEEISGGAFNARPGWDDVCRALPEVGATALEQAALQNALKLLASERVEFQSQGRSMLEGMGFSGVLAAQSIDRSELSEAQRSVIDEVLAGASVYQTSTAEQLQSSRSFLKDCMEMTDPRIVEAATARYREMFGEE